MNEKHPHDRMGPWKRRTSLTAASVAHGNRGSAILTPIIVLIVMAALYVNAHQILQSNYQRRLEKAKETFGLIEVSEALAKIMRQAYDVARVAPRNALNVPQCRLADNSFVDAESLCFQQPCTTATSRYFCWPDPTNPNSRCVVGPTGATYCLGESSLAGSRNDIAPVRTTDLRSNDPPTLYVNARDPMAEPTSFWDEILENWPIDLFLATAAAQAAPGVNFTGGTSSPVLSCPSADPNCKACSLTTECYRISICPRFIPDSQCTANPRSRFVQEVLLTD